MMTNPPGHGSPLAQFGFQSTPGNPMRLLPRNQLTKDSSVHWPFCDVERGVGLCLHAVEPVHSLTNITVWGTATLNLTYFAWMENQEGSLSFLQPDIDAMR